MTESATETALTIEQMVEIAVEAAIAENDGWITGYKQKLRPHLEQFFPGSLINIPNGYPILWSCSTMVMGHSRG